MVGRSEQRDIGEEEGERQTSISSASTLGPMGGRTRLGNAYYGAFAQRDVSVTEATLLQAAQKMR